MHAPTRFAYLAAAVLSACAAVANTGTPAPPAEPTNPFLEDQSPSDKADTAYLNPDGREVEVDLEGDLAPADAGDTSMPANIGQFALSFFRERRQFYLESLAEDSSSEERVEWRVDDVWMTTAAAREASIAPEKLTHYRIRGVNAVALLEDADSISVGAIYNATVPTEPHSLMTTAGDSCAYRNPTISLSEDVYWYLWDPELDGCRAQTTTMRVTVSALMPTKASTYPEYDRLVADGVVTVAVLFGQIGHEELTENDSGFHSLARMATWLTEAGYAEVPQRPVARRFEKTVGAVKVVFDLYSPAEFAGLGDYAHFDNLQTAITEHEIIVYDGHSMLGASSFWRDLRYPTDYQIFLYGGCLGYQYYIRPIVAAKGGWDNLDIVSSVVEVSVDANVAAAPLLAKLIWGLDHDYRVTWRSLIVAVRDRIGDSTFGASGVRDNRFRPGT